MEEKKTLKIKKPYILIFTLAIVFAILGFMDLKVWAMESLTQGPAIEEQYFNADFYEYDYGAKEYVRSQYSYLNPSVRMAWFYSDFEGLVCDEKNFSNVITVNTKGYVLVGYSADGQAANWYGSYNDIRYDLQEKEKSRRELASVNYNSVCDILGYRGSTEKPTNDNYMSLAEAENYCNSQRRSVSLELDTNIPIFTDWECLGEYLETGLYDVSGVVFDWSDFLKNANINDDMPVVANLNFDRIETNEKKDGYINTKTITDYIRFNSNNEYELAIMLCPSVYSPIRSNGFISKFENYNYNSWIYMTTSDKGLKEISCEIGQFSIPTDGVDSIISSNYKSYYNEILYELSDSGSVNFKPTMGYRLMYVDVKNNMVGPSTYILPNSYDNLNPSDETCTLFTLYSDGSHGSEKVMNLKTWEQETGSTLDDMKNVIDKVGDVLDDYKVLDTDLGVGEAKSWLQGVASFIKGTPAFVGSVLSFLPQPILYGIYICIFLSVIAGGYAIIKALI